MPGGKEPNIRPKRSSQAAASASAPIAEPEAEEQVAGEPAEAGKASEAAGAPTGDLTIVANVVCSAMAHGFVASTKIHALQLLARMAPMCSDDVRLNRLLPYALSMYRDASVAVRVASIGAATTVVAGVRHVPRTEAYIFPDYILPVFADSAKDAEEPVRIGACECARVP